MKKSDKLAIRKMDDRLCKEKNKGIFTLGHGKILQKNINY